MPDDLLVTRCNGKSVAVRVWDLPVRLAHWLVALLVALSWVTAVNGWLSWHKLSGYVLLILVIFRIYWGFCGSSTARFSNFMRGPATVASYVRKLLSIRGSQPSYIGHNPLGGWNVAALLSVLLLQAGLGLFAVDVDGLNSGPLAKYVSFTAGRQIAILHQSTFALLLVLIGLHIAAVLAHLSLAHENLIAPMLTGIKKVPCAQAQSLTAPERWRALIGLAASILFILILTVLI